MKLIYNKFEYFSDEVLTANDLLYMCFIIERIARKQKIRNSEVVNIIGYENLYDIFSCVKVYHCESPDYVEDELIEKYNIPKGNFDITDVDKVLVDGIIPKPLDIAGTYSRLIIDSLEEDETYLDGLIKVYNNSICDIIDNYNGSAYYEPRTVILQAYKDGYF